MAVQKVNYKYNLLKQKGIWWGITSLIFIAVACTTTYNTISNREFNQKYNPSQQKLHPEYSIYMNTPNDIRLYFRIFPREFGYYMNEDSIAFAKASLFFRITKDYNSIEILDSLTKAFIFTKETRSSFMGFVPLSLPEDGNYVLEVFLSDMLESYTTSSVLSVNKNGRGSDQSIQFLSKYGSPNFYNYEEVGDTIRVRSSMFNDKGLYVNYYTADTVLPESPDIVSNKLQSVAPIHTTNYLPNPDTALIPLSQLGNYYFSNANKDFGKTINAFNRHYPYVKTTQQMLSGLRYLCTEAEMRSYYKMSNAKRAVDTFWLSKTNDLEKGRELIRVYYNRIQLANYYFSNFKEGWLTDQGMIFVICGAPAVIKTDQDGEHWYYGKGDKESMTFHFYTEEHPIFGTVNVLDRSEVYSGVWYNAITTWRDGRVFSLNP